MQQRQQQLLRKLTTRTNSNKRQQSTAADDSRLRKDKTRNINDIRQANQLLALRVEAINYSQGDLGAGPGEPSEIQKSRRSGGAGTVCSKLSLLGSDVPSMWWCSRRPPCTRRCAARCLTGAQDSSPLDSSVVSS